MGLLPNITITAQLAFTRRDWKSTSLPWHKVSLQRIMDKLAPPQSVPHAYLEFTNAEHWQSNQYVQIDIRRLKHVGHID